MAKATLEVPFSSISGKLSDESGMYVTTRFGETVISTYPKHRDPQKITAHQRELNANFAQAVAQAKIELSDPIRRAYWQEQFAQYQRNPAAYISASISASAPVSSVAPSASASSSSNKPAVQLAPTQHPRYKTLRGFLIAQLTKQNEQTTK